MSTPSAPPAPDYAAANRAAITTDIATLPQRLAAEAAAAQGKTVYQTADGRYTTTPPANEPAGGQALRNAYNTLPTTDRPSFATWLSNYVAGTPGDTGAADYQQWYQNGGATPVVDFSGLGTNQSAIDSQTQLMQAGAGISRDLAKGQLQDYIDLLPQYNQLNLQQQKDAFSASLDAAKQGQQEQLDTELQYRPKFTQSELDAQKAAFSQSLDLSDQGTRRQVQLQQELLPQLNALGLDQQNAAYQKSLKAWQAANPDASQAKTQLVQQLLQGIQGNGDLTSGQQRRVEQNTRMAQAARGNVLGDAAAFDEALNTSGYGEQLAAQKRSELASFLNSPTEAAPQFQAQNAVNPLMPNLSPGNYNPTTPNFTATTTGAPNLQPANIQTGSPWNVTNPNAGQQGVNNANTAFSNSLSAAQFNASQPNPWMQGLGAAAGVASAFI